MSLHTHHTICIGTDCYKIPPLWVPMEAFPIMIYDPLRDVKIGMPVKVTGWHGPLFVLALRPRPDQFGGVFEMVVQHGEPE